MKNKLLLTATLLGVATLSSRAGPDVTVVVGSPAPVVVASPVIMVPDAYIWDGDENVGVINGQYFYLGHDDVWLPLDQDRLMRFHGWERGHADWQTHAIRNEHYRKDARGNVEPVRHDQRDNGNIQPVVNHGPDNHAPQKVNAPSSKDNRSDKGGDKDAKGDKGNNP